MYPNSPAAPICTFVMRFWVEWSGEAQFWRGSIEHLQSGERASFQELDDISDFIRKYVGHKPDEKSNQSFRVP